MGELRDAGRGGGFCSICGVVFRLSARSYACVRNVGKTVLFALQGCSTKDFVAHEG